MEWRIVIALGALAIVVLAEWLHDRRVRRSAYLVFGSSGFEGCRRWWVRIVGWMRAMSMGLAAWGLLTLLTVDGGPKTPGEMEKPRGRVLICLDVSPSMKLKDAGASGKEARADRAREVLRSLLDRMDLTSTRVSVVAFYTSARRVVADTWDMNVVENILNDLPLEYAFKEGPTKMYSGVREAAAMAAKWPTGSTMLVVVSDGDTLPDVEAPKMPGAIGRVLVLGVGNTRQGMVIAGRSSRQDATALKGLAARLRGTYLDVNERHVPGAMAREISWMMSPESGWLHERTLGLIAAGMGGGVLGLLWPMLAWMERRWKGRADDARDRRLMKALEGHGEADVLDPARRTEPVLMGGER